MAMYAVYFATFFGFGFFSAERFCYAKNNSPLPKVVLRENL